MIMKTFPIHNQINLPEVGFGTYKITEQSDMNEAVKAAKEAGYTYYDTAAFYGNERQLSQALKEANIQRDEILISTKLWNKDQGKENTKKAIEKTLERLDTEYIDLYLIHWPCPESNLFIESYKVLEEYYEKGILKSIGVCNFTQEQLKELMENTTITPAVNQVECHPYLNQHELQAYCKQHGIHIMAWSPINRLRDVDQEEVMIELSEKYNKSIAQIILKWHIERNRIVIPKSKTPSRIKDNIDLYDFELKEEELKKIDDLNSDRRYGVHPNDFTIEDSDDTLE